MKKLGIAIIAAGSLGLSLSVEAQEVLRLEATNLNPIKFSGSFYSGMKNISSGKVTGGATKTLIGPFVQPSLSLKTKGDNYSLSLGYTFEAFGGAGVGGGHGSSSKRFQDNGYFLNYPSVALTGQFNDSLSMLMYAEYAAENYTGDQASNFSGLATISDLKQKLSDSVTIGIGYSFSRSTSPDSLGLSNDLIAGNSDTKSLASMNAAEQIKAFNNAFVSPTQNVHVGRALAEFKIGESATWKTYVQAGKIINVRDDDVYTYRWNNDLSTPITADLDLWMRYRVTFSDKVNSADLGWAHQLRANLTYKLNDKWSVAAENNFVYKQSTKATVDEAYSSENYLGVSYSF
ncbi:MAG: hypothetical protein ACO3LE_07865 [Bdellovibrionota bacterium]